MRHSSSRFGLLPEWLGIQGLILVAIIGVLSYYYESFKEQLPWLITAQLWSYQKVSELQPRRPRSQFVTTIEIDKDTFDDRGAKSPRERTSRALLAQLVDKAVEADAAVIVLDINLDSSSEDDREPLLTDNQSLLNAIGAAQQKKIPVVLAFGFEGREHRPIAHLFEDNSFSVASPEPHKAGPPAATPRFGFDHAPGDFRKVPLTLRGKDGQDQDTEYASLALQAVDAYETAAEIMHPTRDLLSDKLLNHEFVYTTYLPRDEFNHVSAKDLTPAHSSQLRDHAADALRHRIVLIGGYRHAHNNDTDHWLDEHKSPVGLIPGMYLHANYIEGLLDNRVLFNVPRMVAAVIDVILAIGMLYLVGKVSGVWKFVLLLVLFVPLGLAYIAAVNLGYCIDFVVPLLLLLLHPAIQAYVDLLPLPHHKEGARVAKHA